jgi:hypothetical protein
VNIITRTEEVVMVVDVVSLGWVGVRCETHILNSRQSYTHRIALKQITPQSPTAAAARRKQRQLINCNKKLLLLASHPLLLLAIERRQQ